MSFWKGESGQMLVMTALCMTLLLGFLGLSIDVGLFYHTRQNVQIAADAAATAAAVDYLFNQNNSSAVNAGQAASTTNGFTNGSNGVTVAVHVPTSGPETGVAGFYEAIVTTPNATNFMRLFGISSVNVAARAVAGASTIGPCIYLENPTGTALSLKGANSIVAPCGMIVNSTSKNAVFIQDCGVSNQSSIPYIDAVGNGSVPNCPNGNNMPFYPNSAPQTDPFEGLTGPMPPYTSPPCNITSTGTSVTQVSGNPVDNNGVNVSGSTTNSVVCFANNVTFTNVTLPGASSGVIYVFENGLNLGGTATFGSCPACVFTTSPPTFGPTNGAVVDLAGGTLTQNNNALNIYGPNCGSGCTFSGISGIALMQPPFNTTNQSSSNPLTLQFGSSGEVLDGYIYAPGSALYLNDQGGSITATGLVAGSLTGNSTLNIYPYDLGNPTATSNWVVTLVE